MLDACLVGEPTNPEQLGDMIKIGRRGSLTGRLTVRGVQGHVAYPERADNPIPRLLRHAARAERASRWMPAATTSSPRELVITSIDVGNPASNVIPAAARATFNIRFNDRHTRAHRSRPRLRAQLDAGRAVDYDLAISTSGEAFLTTPGPLHRRCSQALIERETRHRTPELSTSGGTSDARFIKDVCPVVEFGLVGATMHQVDERVAGRRPRGADPGLSGPARALSVRPA